VKLEANGTSHSDDEIDLLEVFATLWGGKYLIVCFAAMFIALASLFLWNAERKYTVSYTFTPVSSEGSRPSLAGLGGLASLAGVSLPSSDGGDVAAYKALLRSEEVASSLLVNDRLISLIFANEWNSAGSFFEAPPQSGTGRVVQSVKYLLTGEAAAEYAPPNAPRLAKWLNTKIQVSEDRDTGFLTLSAETADPELARNVLQEITDATDAMIKDRFIESAEGTVEFYQSKLSSARAREHREALAQLIAQEEQKLMLASKGDYFVMEPLTPPTVSLEPTSPKSTLTLALAIVLGLFAGAAISLIKKAFKNAR
jgi:uncharacterized protein involved in exopolysaccharide biosynthesis